MTSSAEPPVSAFLKEGASEWHTLKQAWLGKERQDCVFVRVLKGVGLNGRIPPLFKICITFKNIYFKDFRGKMQTTVIEQQ